MPQNAVANPHYGLQFLLATRNNLGKPDDLTTWFSISPCRAGQQLAIRHSDPSLDVKRGFYERRSLLSMRDNLLEYRQACSEMILSSPLLSSALN